MDDFRKEVLKVNKSRVNNSNYVIKGWRKNEEINFSNNCISI